MVRQNKVRRGTLFKKLIRDLWGNGMQFLAMMLLCALGTWVFSGLDATWRMQERTFETYLTDQRIADFWVRSTEFSRQDIERIRHLRGVETAQVRITMELEAPELEDKVTVMIHGYDGAMSINTPIIREGETLSTGDRRGCLVEEQFARAQGLKTGDSLELTVLGESRTYLIRGIVLSPEYLITARDVAPTPETYGFALMNSIALPEIPFNEVLIRAAEGADQEEIGRAVREMFPEALIITRSTQYSTATARNYVNMFRNMSYLFPVLAYFVAALVVITTLKRMMITQRIQLGTLKSLGYTNRQIRRHYIWYALIPSGIGSAAGLSSGQYTLPDIIWPMIATNMRTPYILRAPISPLAWFMAGFEILLSVLLCVSHVNRALKESTAELLRPKPPKSGTRILLERARRVWGRLSFNSKMIVRNLMRNKGRTMMSMVGMLFCNMLIICSFGLQDSIPYFVREYYEGTLAYNVRVDLKAGRAGSLSSYRRRLKAETVDGLMEISVSFRNGEKNRTGKLTILPDDVSLIRLNEDHSVMDMPGNGILLSEKLAQLMDARVGEKIQVWLAGDNEPLDLEITGFASSNIGQAAYMSESAWKRCRKGEFRITSLLLRGPTADAMNRIDQMDETDSVKYPSVQYSQTLRIMDSASMAFSVLSGVALGLAFVICYNMGLMNFTERTREYATLKVLGYHQREIRRLMLRENNLTAILGVGAGILPGMLLVRIILKMCEYDSMVFAPHVTLRSILLASAITFAFTWCIEGLLTRKVRGIDMVEALKSVE